MLVQEKSHTSWGYVLYDHGAAVDRFWSMPSMVVVEPGLATGHPAQFCETLGVRQLLKPQPKLSTIAIAQL